jgi:hypothetical protein
MAGTIVSDTIQDGAGANTTTTNVINGIARAWVQFQGGTSNVAGTINGSYNVSSVTVVSTGIFTVNFTTARGTANYAAVGNATANDNSTSNDRNIQVFGYASASCGCMYYQYPYSVTTASRVSFISY